MSRKFLIALLFCLSLMFIVGGALAQEPTPAVPPVDIETDAVSLLDYIVTSVLGAVIASPLVVTLVGALKLIPGLKEVSGPVLSFIVGAIVYILAALATQTGYGDQFNSIAELITKILPILLQFAITNLVNPVVYSGAVRVNAPVAGFQRTGQYHEMRAKAA